MTLPSISFSGLATPFDTNAIIDQILAAESIPKQQLQVRRAQYEAKDAAWVSINTRLSALRSAIDDVADLSAFVTASTSHPDAVTATASEGASPGSISFTVDRLAVSHQVTSEDTFADPTATIGAGDVTLTVDGVDYVFTANAATTYDDLAEGLNALDSGVSAAVIEIDAGEYMMLFTSDATGDEAAFDVDSDIGGFTNFTVIQQGLDAQLTVGSLAIERASNTITDLLVGATIELTGTTTSAVSVSVSRDETASADAIEALVTELNLTLEELATATRYDSASGVAGVLVGDSTARTLMSDLRNAMSGAGATDTLIPSLVGISINRTGTFEFDRSELESAISGDYDNLAALVEEQIYTRFDDALDLAEGIDGSVATARGRWQASIDDVDDRIDAWEDRLDRREARLISQFAALDVALATLNSQSDWLTSQLSSLNGQEG